MPQPNQIGSQGECSSILCPIPTAPPRLHALKLQGIQLKRGAYCNAEGLTRRQFQMMIGNSWSLNVASKIIYRLFLATGVATKQQMKAP